MFICANAVEAPPRRQDTTDATGLYSRYRLPLKNSRPIKAEMEPVDDPKYTAEPKINPSAYFAYGAYLYFLSSVR